MSPRARLVVGFSALGILGIVVAALAARRNRVPPPDLRRSSFLSGPNGARALAEALPALGVRVGRYRRAVAELPARTVPDTLLAFLDPSTPLNAYDGRRLLRYAKSSGDLLLAGATSAPAMRCFGYMPSILDDSVNIHVPGQSPGARPAQVRAVLESIAAPVVADSSDMMSGLVVECPIPGTSEVDTLLAAPDGRPVAVRLDLAKGHVVTLVADGAIFRNVALRNTDAGPLALSLLSRPGETVVFDEYHHGFARRGDLPALLWHWSWSSPWGWAFWQLVAVGLLTLAASAVRFGKPRHIIERKRRSPLEHVDALATALAAAGGHAAAVRLMVQGLRRRLSRAGRRGLPTDDSNWLASLAATARTDEARQAAASLATLTAQPQDADGVLAAATAAEEVWKDLKP